MTEPPNETSPGWKSDPSDPSKHRYWDGAEWGPSSAANAVSEDGSAQTAVASDSSSQTTEPTPLAIGLAYVGVALVVVGVFLARYESRTFATIEQNALIQSVDGIVLLALALGTAISTFKFTQKEGNRYSVLILGLILVGASVWLGTGDRLTLESVGGGLRTQTEQATAGLGIYCVGAGGILVAIAGTMLAGFTVEGIQPSPVRSTRKCPHCAETVLAEAKVCKHCGRDLNHVV